ncbi:MAG: ribulose-phosphate 3-epimerase [Lachnoclostridium sp.]|nr:ribulose-phosphate 3-epimerase [Lachnospira sp.]MCM1248973.1 ribulose-phosphate 3-epimerase [Lachnoclostridium sp.]
MSILAPSILAADFWKLGEQIREVEKAGVKYLHIDVMDGVFVPAISYGMPIIASIREKTSLFFDVHLMIDKPERYVETFAELGGDLLNFHLEATQDAEAVIRQIRGTGKKAGITIKPGTPVSAVEPYLPLVDMVLVMTVEPGFGGQVWMPECLDKVKEVRRMVTERNLKTDIEVDGGINFDNIHSAAAAGANIIVSGTSVFKNDICVNIKKLMQNAQKEE